MSYVVERKKMKRIMCFIFLFASCFLISCAGDATVTTEAVITAAETTIGTTTLIETISTTAATATVATATTGTTLEATTVPTQASTVTTTDDFELHIVGNYVSTREIPFEKLHKFSNNYRSNGRWYTDVDEAIDVRKNRIHPALLMITIIGYSGEKSVLTQPRNFAEYYVYRHSCGDYVSDGKTYRMMTSGYPEEPIYGLYRIDIGEKYIAIIDEYAFSLRLEGDDMKLVPNLFKIVEIDGVEWVYPSIYHDFSTLKYAVRITDKDEKLFYKKGADDDIIAYLEKNNIPNPKIEYKCELNAFIEEISTWKNQT